MKYILFDADTKEYLDAFDTIGDWGYVVKQFQTKDFTLIYRRTSNNDWTYTMFHGTELDCIKCDGKLKQIGGSNYDRYTKAHYKCRACDIEMEMMWDKHAMKNRVTPYVERLPTEDQLDDQPCEEIST